METTKTLNGFLRENKLIITAKGKEVDILRTILKEVNEIFVIEYTEEKATHAGYQFKIFCPSTSFANAYYTIGCKLKRRMKIKQHDELQSKIPIKYSKK